MHRRPKSTVRSFSEDDEIDSFKITPFQYNERVALVVLPTVVLLLGFGGPLVIGSMTIGLLLVYICDLLGTKGAALATGWGTLLSMNLGLMFVFFYDAGQLSLPLTICLLALSGTLLLACGFWITLQFQWIHYQNPGMVEAMERALFCLLPLVCPVIQTWAVFTLTGVGAVPYYLLSSMMVCHAICSGALTPYFSRGQGHPLAPSGETQLCDDFSCLVQEISLFLLPGILYLGTHAPCADIAKCTCSVLLLSSISALYCIGFSKCLTKVSNRMSEHNFRNVQQVGLVLSAVGLVFSLQHRVIFPSYAEFIVLHWPWNYVGVTLALFSLLAAIRELYIFNSKEEHKSDRRMTVFLLVGVIAGCVTLGVPWYLLPAPIGAALVVPSFVCKPSPKPFLVIVLGIMATTAWFLSHHFWSLEICFGSIPCRSVCYAIFANLLASLIVAYCVYWNGLAKFREWITIGYVALFVLFEGRLVSANNSEEPAYPLYLFAATGIAGVLAAMNLQRLMLLSSRACQAAIVVCASKIPLLLFPGSPEVLYVALLFSFAFLWPKYLLLSRKSVYWIVAFVFQGVLALLILTKIRFFVFDTLLWMRGSRPSDGSLIGVLLLLACLVFTPLTYGDGAQDNVARRVVTVASIFSLMVLLLEPPLPVETGAVCPKLPFGWCPRLWDSRHVPEHMRDDSLIYGEQRGRHAHYQIWFLVIATMLILLVSTQSRVTGGSRRASVRRRVAFFNAVCLILSGVLVGLYVSFEFFSRNLLLQLVVCFSCASCTMLLALLMSGGDTGSNSTKFLFLLLLGSFLLSLVVQQFSRPDKGGPHGDELSMGDSFSQKKVATCIVYSCMFGLVAFVIKIKMRQLSYGADSTRRKAGHFRRAEVPGGRQIMKLKEFRRLNLSKLAYDGKLWVPLAGNIATAICFGASMQASYSLVGNADGAVFLISPILLMLNQDALFLRSLTMAKRYLPVSISIAAYLVLSIVTQLYQQMMSQDAEVGTGSPAVSSNLLKDCICLLATLPTQVAFAYSLVNMTWRDRVSAFLVPLNLPVLFLAHLQTIKILAAFGIGEFCLQLLAKRQLQKIGMRVL
mmetsp:Transcript_291/g.2328  ORF Transcript_291/g.2328 Transcript_291/m.2328 type:complete len:1078 (+) Transcript_291:412-3645(+)